MSRFRPVFELHVIIDNYATHKQPKVRAWLVAHPRYHIHHTLTRMRGLA
jgi:hypothetical protein